VAVRVALRSLVGCIQGWVPCPKHYMASKSIDMSNVKFGLDMLLKNRKGGPQPHAVEL
jgi:hypothetical protein